MRVNKAKWCRIHKRPLIHENDARWYTVTCPGHFRVTFPLTEPNCNVYTWRVERFSQVYEGVKLTSGMYTQSLYGR